MRSVLASANRFVTTLLPAVIVGALTSSPAWAQARECLPDQSLCVGDPAYGYALGTLTFGTVRNVPKDGSDEIRVGDKAYPTRDVARVKRASCALGAQGTSLCPGDPVRNGGAHGIVLGAFPTGYVVISEPGKPIVSQKGTGLEVYDPDCQDILELKAAVRGVEHIQKELRLPSAPNCVLPWKSVAKAPTPPQDPPKNGDCNEPSSPIVVPNSAERSYFERLLQTGMNARIEDFLKLWNPKDVDPTIEGYIMNCLDDSDLTDLKRDGSQDIVDECKPDVLYSWGPRAKLENITKTLQDNQEWSSTPNPPRYGVYATVSPASTYSYGLIPVRFKIKPEVKFGKRFAYGEKGQIFANSGFGLADFKIHESSAIESISYGTPEHYDEIIKDILRIRSGKKAMIYSHLLFRMAKGGMDRVYLAGVSEVNRQDETMLKKVLLEMIRMILSGEGRIHYNKGACRSREHHFATQKPTYFNER